MSVVPLAVGKGELTIIEYTPGGLFTSNNARGSSTAASTPACVLLLPGTSIRPGPGADKAAKYRFDPEVHGIYRSIARCLSIDHGIPCLQLCWRKFPADGGTTHDAITDMFAALRYMRSKYGPHCGALIVGYSFGGAAILAILAASAARPEVTPSADGATRSRHSWLLGAIALSGALKGGGDDTVSLLSAMQFLQKCSAPMLIIHGTEDDNVAFSAAQKLFKHAPSMKSLLVLEGADHNLRDPSWAKLVADACSQWLALVAAPRGAAIASRNRAALLAHHSGAAALCRLQITSYGGCSASFAFDPTPQTIDGVACPSYRTYEVPTVLSNFVPVPHGKTLPKQEARTKTTTEDIEAAVARQAERLSVHLERQQRGRERRKLERVGNLPSLIQRLKERQAAQEKVKGDDIGAEETHDPRCRLTPTAQGISAVPIANVSFSEVQPRSPMSAPSLLRPRAPSLGGLPGLLIRKPCKPQECSYDVCQRLEDSPTPYSQRSPLEAARRPSGMV
eukprot:TRINITY_DN70316_c0_g1_i1.p1 TRINITY_DN70316_c0_g1~~TRINITY_DN70316_c0_g1_i1.p1  ORF type:complete len:507 (-),score=52.47 TRINITY_DN70316_c0_g1_i1:318-1838(-)